jgi:signal transduction histidine kinase
VSLRVRLVAAFAYVLVLVIVALLVPLALNLSRRVDAEVKSEARGQAQLLAASASGRLGNSEELDRLVAGAADQVGGRVIIVGPRGRLLADSAGTGLRSTSYANRPEVAQALDGQPAQGTRHSDTLDTDVLFTAVPVLQEGRTAGAVRVTQDVNDVQHEVRKDVIALIGVGLVALLLGLGVAWLLAGSLARPLLGLARTARRVAGGDLDARAEVEGSSEQREVAAAFNEMTGRLGRALRAQREFVANASHQLRTPLTGLRLRIEAAALKSKDPAVDKELNAAEHETERLAQLLTELLTLARERERPPAEPIALDDAVAAAGERWEGPAESSGHDLVLREGEPAVTVAASRDDIAAILDNLIENALNYSPEGTAVTVEWEARNGRARLVVLDEGPGISAEEGDLVFERFYRGAASRGGAAGTGLGLSVVEALARRWGGEATIANRPEGGARAEVTLPLHGEGLPKLEPELDEALPDGG